jgi:hypothetical protein
MKKKATIITTILLLVFVALGVNVKTSQAATSKINLSISPPITYVSIKPGEKKQYEIKIENPGNTTLEVTPSLLDFETDGQTGQPVVKETGTFPYINIQNTNPSEKKLLDGSYTISVKPRQKINVPIIIDVPKSATQEEYYMTIFFTFKNANQEDLSDTKARVAGTIGSNLIVLVTRNGSDKGNMIIKRITSWPTIDSFMPLKFSVLAENIGENASPASGSATITDWENNEVATFEFHPDMILKESSRQLREKEFLSNQFRYKKPFLFGIYKITTKIKQNSLPEAEDFVTSKTIIALPFSILILPLVGILLYLGYKAILRKTKHFKG